MITPTPQLPTPIMLLWRVLAMGFQTARNIEWSVKILFWGMNAEMKFQKGDTVPLLYMEGLLKAPERLAYHQNTKAGLQVQHNLVPSGSP